MYTHVYKCFMRFFLWRVDISLAEGGYAKYLDIFSVLLILFTALPHINLCAVRFINDIQHAHMYMHEYY